MRVAITTKFAITLETRIYTCSDRRWKRRPHAECRV